jgi:hypothetical protein
LKAPLRRPSARQSQLWANLRVPFGLFLRLGPAGLLLHCPRRPLRTFARLKLCGFDSVHRQWRAELRRASNLPKVTDGPCRCCAQTFA